MSIPRAVAVEIRDLRVRWRKSDDQYRVKPTAMRAHWRTPAGDDGPRYPCPNVAHPDYDICKGCIKHRTP